RRRRWRWLLAEQPEPRRGRRERRSDSDRPVDQRALQRWRPRANSASTNNASSALVPSPRVASQHPPPALAAVGAPARPFTRTASNSSLLPIALGSPVLSPS